MEGSLKDVLALRRLIALVALRLGRPVEAAIALRLWPRSTENLLSLFMLLVSCVHNLVPVICDELFHVLKRIAHLSSASDQSNKYLRIASVALSVSNSEMVHQRDNVLALNAIDSLPSRAVVQRRAHALRKAT